MEEFMPGARKGNERRNKKAISKEVSVTRGTGNRNWLEINCGKKMLRAWECLIMLIICKSLNVWSQYAFFSYFI
jgi:hypothetical protein